MAKKVLKTVGKVAGFALGGGLLGKALSGKKKAAAPEEGPQIMPLPDDERIRLAKKRRIAEQMQRGGRSSTILSDPTDTLG